MANRTRGPPSIWAATVANVEVITIRATNFAPNGPTTACIVCEATAGAAATPLSPSTLT